MANIKSFPNNQDEYIGAEHVMRWLHGRTSGVFGAEGNAAVSHVVDSMTVTVSDGNGWLSNDNADGVVWWIDSEAANGHKLELAVDMADAILPRIDRVVVSWQTTNYVALPEVSILKGTAATNPVAPELTNNNILRQISLAKIRIPAGATTITADMITDERLDGSVCGLVTCGIGVDTSVMQAQWQASYANFLDYLAQQQAAWDAFFQNIQNDTVFPVPNIGSAGYPMRVNSTGDGYILSPTVIEYETTIPVEGWTKSGSGGDYFVQLPVEGITGRDNPIVDYDASKTNISDEMLEHLEWWGTVHKISTATNKIEVRSKELPTVAIPIKIKVVR